MNKKSIFRAALFLVFSCGFFLNSGMAQTNIYKKNLTAKYPNAKHVEWEMDDGYMTAEFLDERNQE